MAQGGPVLRVAYIRIVYMQARAVDGIVISMRVLAVCLLFFVVGKTNAKAARQACDGSVCLFYMVDTTLLGLEDEYGVVWCLFGWEGAARGFAFLSRVCPACFTPTQVFVVPCVLNVFVVLVVFGDFVVSLPSRN